MQANENALTPEQIIGALFFFYCQQNRVSLLESKALLAVLGGSKRLKDLNTHLGLKNSTATAAFDSFEGGGRLKRTQSKLDRRAIDVSFTKKGVIFLQNFLPTVSAFLSIIDTEKAQGLIQWSQNFMQKISLLK